MTTTASAWGKSGSWALDAEENESELIQQRNQDSAPTNGVFNGAESADYPSLAAAASTKTKKKKPQTLSLQEFSTYSAGKTSAAQSKGLTSDEIMRLPTGPRERTAEELDRSKLGGGFRSYGSGARDDQPRRQGGFNREFNREIMPSRADENDNWGAAKKLPANNGFERRERGGFFTDSHSRADDADSWSSNKRYVAPEPRKYEKRAGFGMGSNGADSNSSWLKRKEEDGGKVGSSFDSLRERRGGSDFNGPDSESWGRKRDEGSDGGRPRLNLLPRTLPVGEEKKSDIGNTARAKSNPFGEARPREEVLKEKGKDWKEIDEKLQASKTKESAAAGPRDGFPVERRNFWSGRERPQHEDRTERTWKKPESIDSRSSSPRSSANEQTGEDEVKGN